MLTRIRTAIGWTLIAAFTYGVAAKFSVGFYHADEHFQLLEFAFARLGHHPLLTPAQMPLEYTEKIRPWLQPAIAAGVYHWLQNLGSSSISWLIPEAFSQATSLPWIWTELLRWMSAALGLLSLMVLARGAQTAASRNNGPLTVLAFGAALWCLPAFHARFSSESWSASFVAIGIGLQLLAQHSSSPRPAIALATGMAYGLAFECRFQVAIMILGALLHLLVFFPITTRWRSLVPILAGWGVVFFIGRGLDQWGYQISNPSDFVLTPYRYFDFNILQSRLTGPGGDPWWDYVRRATTEAFPLLGLLLLLSIGLSWITGPFSLTTWASLPFTLFHFTLPHKELRFLFPLLGLAPLWLASLGVFSPLSRLTPTPPGASRSVAPGLLKIFKHGLLWTNLLALGITSLAPLTPGLLFIQKLDQFMERSADATRPQTLFQIGGSNPFEYGGVELWVYRPARTQLVALTDANKSQCAPGNLGAARGCLIVTAHQEHLEQLRTWGLNCRLVVSQYPAIVDQSISWLDLQGIGPKLNLGNPLSGRIRQWKLFTCAGG